jgi:pilus assembly protein TadC
MKSYTLPYYIYLIFLSIFLFVLLESIIHKFTTGDLIALGVSGAVSLMFYADYKRYKREYMLRQSKYKRLVDKLEKEIKDERERKDIENVLQR